jgi:hypothetical protein
MKALLTTAAAAGALLILPQAASAKVAELGAGAGGSVSAVCPSSDECAAPGRVTGYQGRSGSKKNPFYVRRAGYIVAFTVTLNDPARNQSAYFGDIYGSSRPSVRLAILRRGDTRKTRRNTRLLRQSPAFGVRDYLGSSPTFVLRKPLRVNPTNIIGLTIPTWAPVFGKPSTSGDYWRASRPKNRCRDVKTDVQHTTGGEVETYGCDYKGVRLQYSATYVPDPRPTRGKDDDEQQPLRRPGA